VYRTKLGIAMRATAQNQEVAGLMGIDINKVISLTFVIGAALGAVAGVMVGSYYGIAHYQMGFILGLKAFSAAVLGGIGNLAGAMLGGLLLGVIEALGAGYVGDLTNLCNLASWSDALAARCESDPNLTLFGSNYQDVFAFLVLIAVLIFRPSGLLGERVADRA
jgi:branched-chain amino acid transport system permease protein